VACRILGAALSVIQAIANNLEGEEVFSLLAQDVAKSFDVFVEELPVARRRSLGTDKPLALEEPDLRNRDVGELAPQQGQDVTDRSIAALRQRSLAAM
jgi:hypothetical protein